MNVSVEPTSSYLVKMAGTDLCETVNDGIKSFLEGNVHDISDRFWPVFTQGDLKPGRNDLGYCDGIIRRSPVDGLC